MHAAIEISAGPKHQKACNMRTTRIAQARMAAGGSAAALAVGASAAPSAPPAAKIPHGSVALSACVLQGPLVAAGGVPKPVV